MRGAQSRGAVGVNNEGANVLFGDKTADTSPAAVAGNSDC